MEKHKWITGFPKMYLFDISADGGKTWTAQWLTEEEADEHRREHGYILEEHDVKRFLLTMDDM